MTLLTQTIERAMKDRAPTMYADLKAEGKLTAYLRETAEQVSGAGVSGAMEMRQRQGWDKQNLSPVQMAAKLAAARSSAMESALAEALEFPQAETSSPSQG